VWLSDRLSLSSLSPFVLLRSFALPFLSSLDQAVILRSLSLSSPSPFH
jgi:hypothetical protein